MTMQLNDFNFELPPLRIARYPLAKRSESRLLCLDKQTGNIAHRKFYNILDDLNEGDLLVFNDTKVIPARLFGHKKTGGRVEVFVERILSEKSVLAQVRASKSPHIDDELFFANDVCLKVINRFNEFYELRYEQDDSILSVIEKIGEVPLPHYMKRSPEESDRERYQTIYAKHKGSVAAPTAGFHFDEELLGKIREKKVELAYLTLHIGAGTFAPVRVETIQDHKMHAEYFQVTDDLCAKIIATKQNKKRVIAVGTTTLRALESASASGFIQPFSGETQIFIYPGFKFHCVDALVTNLHLPRSTLLMLVCAFGGYENMMRAYNVALSHDYRFYSYGDAMWIV